MIKIAFNIPRRNWYRVLAAPINEALRRGWDVTCLHGNEERRLQKDFASPTFSALYDKAAVIEKYKGADEFASVLHNNDFDVVVDADLIPLPLSEIFNQERRGPLKVLLDGITHPRLQFGVPLAKYDLYIVPSQWHIESTINIMSRNHSVTFSQAEERLGPRYKKFLTGWRGLYVNRWSEEDILYYRDNSIIVGTPSLDDLRLIDRKNVRERWGIPADATIVGLLPSPWDIPMGYLWGDLNMATSYFEQVRIGIAYGMIKELPAMFRAPKDKDFVEAIARFCKNNGALLAAKLRKDRKAKTYLADRADIIVGEDSNFPHTSLELFAISDVVFGFCSTGAFECIAADTPYVDLNIPLFPKKEVIELSSPSTEVVLPWEGVIYEMSAESSIANLPSMKLDAFRLDGKARIEYLNHFTSGVEGSRSSLMMDAIELKLNQRKKHSAVL